MYSQVWLPATSSEAKAVPTSRLICAAEALSTAGPISRRIRRTPGSAGPQRGRGSRPRRASAGTWTSIWIAPAANTPQARAITGTDSSGASHSAAAMIARLCRIGVSAGMAKRLKLLSTPPAMAVIEMKNR